MKYKLIVIFVIVLLFCSWYFTPIDFIAGACSGGYRGFIIQENKDEFDKLVTEVLRLDFSDNVIISYQPDEVSWKGRNIYVLAYCKEDNDNLVNFQYVMLKGSRGITNKFLWKVVDDNYNVMVDEI